MKTAFQIILLKIIVALRLPLSGTGVFCKGFIAALNNTDGLCMN